MIEEFNLKGRIKMTNQNKKQTMKEKRKESLNYCERDYKHKHYWQLVGNHLCDYLIYRCSQCLKCKLVKLKYLSGIHIEEYDFSVKKR